MEFTLTNPDTGIKDILVIFDGVPYEADSNHPWWDEIVRLCVADDPRVLDLFPIRSVQRPSEEIAFEDDSTHPEEPRWLPHNVDQESREVLFGGALMAVSSPAPDEQARAEVSAHLNRTCIQAAHVSDVSREADEWQVLFGIAIGVVEELREDLRDLIGDLDYELERSSFLEAALQHYASHAWNDIKRELGARRS
jgi:hypothetical protein